MFVKILFVYVAVSAVHSTVITPPILTCRNVLCMVDNICVECNNGCQNTCADPTGNNCTAIPQPPVCRPGCRCRKDMLFDEIKKKCVYPCDCSCPRSLCDSIRCPANEECVRCKDRCECSCDDPTGSNCPPGIDQCITGCQCKKGYVRDRKTGKCVLPKACPPTSPCSYIKCTANSTCVECKNPCQRTCQNPTGKCPLLTEKCKPGCQCNDKFLYDEESGRCVEPCDCPRACDKIKCKANEECVECKSACPLSCDNPYPYACPTPKTICESGCQCKAGFLWNPKKNSCTPRCDCPK